MREASMPAKIGPASKLLGLRRHWQALSSLARPTYGNGKGSDMLVVHKPEYKALVQAVMVSNGYDQEQASGEPPAPPADPAGRGT